MNSFRPILVGLILTFIAPLASVRAEPGVSKGEFIVVAAPRNPPITNSQAAYRADDPQLVDRLVVFDGSTASFDGDYKACARITNTTVKVRADRLLSRIFPDEVKYGKRYVARLSQFGLATAPTTMVSATRFRCAFPRGNHGADWTGATLFPVGKGKWALSIIQDSLLILAPVTGPIRASFDCAQAKSVVEKTICGDRLLAGWDRSVAAAFAQGSGDQADQRAWLAERDKCGADTACLHESMSLRTSNLLR